MNKDYKLIQKTLDLLIERAENFEDFVTIKFAIDDYIEEGYYIKEQIQKYNDRVNKFYSKRNQDHSP